MENQSFFRNENDQIYTVKLAWKIGQDFVCGTLEEIVKYALIPNNGIEGFYELTNNSIKKVTKKELKSRLSHGLKDLSEQLFKKY